MRYFITLSSLFFFKSPLFSQELKLTMDYGYAVAEMTGLKKIMLQTGVKAGMDLGLKKNFTLSFSAGVYLLQHSYTNAAGESVFNKKYFLTFPVSLERYYPFSKRSAGFVEAGIYGARCQLDKKEIRNTGSTRIERRNGPGWGGGGLLCIGFKTMITPVVSFSVGLQGQKDLISRYKLDQDKIKTERTSLVINFYRKL